MKLYKFKSLQNFDHIADIFSKERLYAARLSELNDPMEGVFEYMKNVDAAYKKDFDETLQNMRICSFSRKRNNVLIWSHYAERFRGICIEVVAHDNLVKIRHL